MALRSKTMTKPAETEESAQEQPSQRRRPEAGQFQLQVDRQTKASFSSFDEAENAGKAIKQAHPIVSVTIYDAESYERKIID